MRTFFNTEFRSRVQNKFLLFAASALATSPALASYYMENGIECLDKRPTISVGDLVEVGTNFGQVYNRGPHIYLYSNVVHKLIKLRLHKAGNWHPIKAERLDRDVFDAEVTNDFKESFRYIAKPVEKDLLLEIWSENLESLIFSERFKNCTTIR
jgi:hypothetical protein